MAILVIAVCAVMCGAEGWAAMADDGKSQREWFAALLDWPHGIPGQATCRRVWSRLDPEALPQGFISWPEALSDVSGGESGAIDGPTGRHAFDHAASTAAIHRVRAWARADRLGLGQRKGEEQAHAMTAMPQLFQRLASKEAGVTMAAMGCQQEMAQVLTAQEADAVLALKAHPTTLDEEVTRCCAEARGTAVADIAPASQETVEGDHGRSATRRSWIPSASEWGGATASWAKWPSMGRVEARREVGETGQSDTRSCLTSLPAQGVRFAQAVRQPWGSENALHGVLDVAGDEDACRMRQDQGAQTFAVLRHLAFNLLRRERHHKRGIKARRKRAGWDRDYLAQVLMG